MDELNLGNLTGKAYGSHEHYSVSFLLIFEVLPSLFHICHIEANGGVTLMAIMLIIVSLHSYVP